MQEGAIAYQLDPRKWDRFSLTAGPSSISRRYCKSRVPVLWMLSYADWNCSEDIL